MSQKRLYVLINNELDPIYGCVQAGHAVAQWLIDNKETQTWNNQYLIYLSADLNKCKTKLEILNINHVTFREPDLNDIPTAIAVEHSGTIFQKLKLVGLRTS